MISPAAAAAPENDLALVAQSLAGSQSAFGRIVERYQTLICALAFSATGSVSQSEDLAQKTFVIAWQRLAALREPEKLRSWLCGIARHAISAEFRRQGREPAHAAETLEAAEMVAAPEAAPPAQAIKREELELLWREIGQLPEIYREPLVLFYREHQSVTRVAEALELSEDAVSQRLSRGRKLVHERMLAFVETALERTNPGAGFAAGVQAALPPLAVGSQAAAGAMLTKGAAAKGGTTLWVLVSWMLGPLIGVFASLGLSWFNIRQASNRHERRFAVRWNTILWLSVAGLMLGMVGINLLADRRRWGAGPLLHAETALWFCYLLILSALLVHSFQNASRLCRQIAAANVADAPVTHRILAQVVIGSAIASTSWLIWVAWVTGDRGTASIFAVITVGLIAWNLHCVRGQTKAAAYRINGRFHGLLCVVILTVVNLRLDDWLAPIHRVSLAEMQRLLPMGTVHLLTLLLVAWAAALLALTKPADRAVGPAATTQS
jgi:RNA polymerase sigma factor (sigma-70 family)